MARLKDVCRHIRSKNAGPFWVTIDLFFDGPANYGRYRDSPALGPELFARLYGVEARAVKRFPIDSLQTIKVSFPRANPQGGVVERDMHCGQQYARLLDVEVG
jgi:hypothetical protein